MKKIYLFFALGLLMAVGVQAETIDLSTQSNSVESITLKNGDVLTGKMDHDIAIKIESGASITLWGANINGDRDLGATSSHAGIACNGNATINIKGKNYVAGSKGDKPAIFIPKGYTLTIQEAASGAYLKARSGWDEENGEMAPAIGAKRIARPYYPYVSYNPDAGNITIKSGHIEAYGGVWSSAIGAGLFSNCGNIRIEGGKVEAHARNNGAAIGSGTVGDNATPFLDREHESKCGDIDIVGGEVYAYSNNTSAIGGGAYGDCGNITITSGVTSIYAECIDHDRYSIGLGNGGSKIGTVTVMGQTYTDGVSENPYIYPEPVQETCPEPTNVTVSDVTSTTAEIAWDADESAEKFYVRYYPASTDTYYNEVETTSTSCTLTNLEPDEKYYVYVVAQCQKDVTSNDHPDMIHFTTEACAAPSNLTADAEYNSATITWEAGSNNSQWMVYIRESNQSDFTYLTTTYSKSYEVDGLEIGKLYVVRVKSLCGYAEGEEATVVFKTKKSAPVPTNVKVSDVTNHAATIDWTPGDDKQDKWDVILNDGFHDNSYQVTKHPITFSNLVAETHYTIKVRGYDNGAKSDWSSEVTFNTDLDPDAEIYATRSGSTMTIYFDNRKSSRSGVLSKWTPGSGASNMSDADLAAIQSATIDASMQNAAPGSLERWFNNMSNLQSVSGLQNLNTSRATTMVAMFNECTALSSLNLSNFETSNVVYMNDMFSGCTNLQTLDLTNFTTKRVQEMSYMFYGCSALTTIVCDNDWSMASAASSWMFMDCSNLQGGRGTVYNENETGRWYAHPDGGVSNPGYFTTYKTSEEDLAAAKADLMQWITLAMEVGEVLRKSGETEGAQSVINAVDNAMTVYSDDEATLEQIDAQMQALETELSRWTDAVLAYYQQLMIAKLQDLLEDGDSEACQKIIADAIETINEVTWDDSKNFADALARLEKTMDEIYQEAKIRLFAQRKADEATAIDEVSIQKLEVSCQKILRDGQILILRGEKVYTITGQEVK